MVAHLYINKQSRIGFVKSFINLCQVEISADIIWINGKRFFRIPNCRVEFKVGWFPDQAVIRVTEKIITDPPINISVSSFADFDNASL
jgi:hypothetical protein